MALQVVEEAELAACCRKHAMELLGLSPKGLRLTKWLLNHSQDRGGDGAGSHTTPTQGGRCVVSPCPCDGIVSVNQDGICRG